MGKMTLAQARKMVAGTMKGDSAMAQAMKELMTGEAVTEDLGDSSPAASPSSEERGAHTLARMRSQQDEGGF